MELMEVAKNTITPSRNRQQTACQQGMGRPGEAKTGTKENSQTPMELEPIASFAQPARLTEPVIAPTPLAAGQPPQTFGTDMKPFLDKNWHQPRDRTCRTSWPPKPGKKDDAHLRVSPNPLHNSATATQPCVAHIRDALPDWQALYKE